VTTVLQKAQLSLTNRPTLVDADVSCCVVRSCPLDSDLLAVFSDFTYPLTFRALDEDIPSSNWFIFGREKLKCLGYNLVKVAR